MAKADAGPGERVSGHHWSRRDLAAMLAVALVAVGVYANSLPNEFVYDDRAICLHDERTRDLRRVREVLTQNYWATLAPRFDAIEDQPQPCYRPIPLLSFAINHALTGPNPWAYRLVNLLLHAGVCAAVCALSILLFRRAVVALVAGLVFAVHPVHTEAVVNIVGRCELLAALTALTAVVLHIQDALRDVRRRLTWRYAATLALFFVGIFSKESAITTVGLILAADVWLKARGLTWARAMSWRRYLFVRLLRRYIGLFVIVVFFLTVRRLVLGQAFSTADLVPATQNILMGAAPGERLLTCLLVLAKYVYLLFIPHPLSYDYSPRVIELQTALWRGPVLAGLACVGAMVAAIVVSGRRRGEVAAAVVFFVITYSVASNVLIPISTLMAERLIYLPSVGVCMLWGLAAGAVATRWRRPIRLPASLKTQAPAGVAVVVVCLGTVLGVYGVLTVRRNRVWRSNEVLFETGVRIQPLSHECWLNLAQFHLDGGDPNKGLEYLDEALRLAPHSYEILARMGWERARAGRRREAIELLTRASAHSGRRETFTRWVRAGLYHRLGQLDEAVRLYEETLAIKPDHQVSLVNLTAIHADPDAGRHYDLKKAYGYATRAATLPAPQPQALVALADVCVKMQRRTEARRTIARGLKLLDAYRNKARRLGKLAGHARRYDQLEASLREMLRTIGPDADAPSSVPSTNR